VDLSQNKYHPECFVCTSCKQPISLAYAFDPDGHLCCETCVREMINISGSDEDVCTKCGKRIGGEVLLVGNSRYHSACFTCVSCGSSLESKEFIVSEKGLKCKACLLREVGEICVVCNKMLEEGGIKAMNKFWHRECFNCIHCRKNLSEDGQFLAEDNRPSCYECATKAHQSSSTATAPAASSSSGESKPKFCWECGAATRTAAKFCQDCGISLVS